MNNYKYCKTKKELIEFISGYRDVIGLNRLSERQLRGIRWEIIQEHEKMNDNCDMADIDNIMRKKHRDDFDNNGYVWFC